MANETKSKDSRDRSKPGSPEGSAPENDQRRFRGSHQGDQETAADARRDAVRGEETATDAPTDPVDDAFLKSSK